MMRIAVIGAGAWGTALARLLCTNGHNVCLWGRNAAHLKTIRATRQNERLLPGVILPQNLELEASLQQATSGRDCIVVAVPSKSFREVVAALGGYAGILVSVTKGIDYETGLTMTGILRECAPRSRVAALSGPSLAAEVARGMPCAVVAAALDPEAARQVQQCFHSPSFRVYTSQDVLGVELGGALKNVIAIGAGMCDGLGFGDNAKAALITRAIVEIRRLGVAAGAQADTFAGLSGLGDLTVTCFSSLSRNRSLGEELGRGRKLEEILERSQTVAEGCPTARAAHSLARKLKVSTPIIDEVFAMLYEGKDVERAVRDLMSRESKPET